MTATAAHIEERTQQLGRALLAAADGYRPGPAERIQDWLLTHAVADARFRSRLLRYLDVLAALDHDESGAEAKRLAHEYFGEEFPELPFALRWLLRIARNEHLPARLVGETARRSAELFARRFITEPGVDTVRATTEELEQQGRYPSFDLLGEAVLSDREAEAYVRRYLRMIDELAGDPAAGTRTVGKVAALQVSLKLSSLTPHFTPLDPEGTIARVRPPLEAIVEAAERAGVGITIDMEQYAYRDLTWELFRRTFAAGERFGGWPDAGIVLQAYLREADRHAEEMVAFARERGTPFQVRLVKGAYWDYETIVAEASGWEPPVFLEKRSTDSQFERVLDILVPAHPELRLAVGSHNARAHARAAAVAEAAGLPPGAIEHQTLYRTAEGISRALDELGWVARDYVPVGELLPGMAYLVRRVLENSSQAGFLLQSRSGVSDDELLRAPPPTPAPQRAPVQVEGFRRASEARWFDADVRARFDAALERTREAWGEHFPLTANGEALPLIEELAIHSPSHPTESPVGHVELAGVEATERAIEVANRGAERWAATPVADRAAILGRAADLLEERGPEFAAWVVHEGGRDRADARAEVDEAVDFLRYYSTQALALFEAHGGHIAPRGVVATIPPWNFSLSIPCGLTVASLACGNAAILKPAEQTPLIAQRLVQLLHEAGVPRDAVICLPGRGEVGGQHLVESPRVAMVAFTGSRGVGTWMHERVAHVPLDDGRRKALVAEMGGKNAIIVFSDADLDETVEAIVHSAFGHANQKCSAASRVLVSRPLLKPLRDRLIEAAGSLVVGPADDPATQVNPIIDSEARQRLTGAAATARAECEVLLDQFDTGEGLEAGPLIVQLPAGRTSETQTATQELFGPIVVLAPFDSEDEAYRVANETPYGLTAGVFSRSPRKIERAARAIEAGNIYVNRGITGARVAVEPFGGMRLSGTGPKAGGPDYLWAFVRRTDAPSDRREDRSNLEAALAAPARDRGPRELPDARWREPFARRVEAIEHAAVLLGQRGEHAAAEALLGAAQAARRELGRPHPTLQVAGQRSELRYDTPRGLCVAHLTGDRAAWWLAAALLAGNGVALFDSPALEPVVTALRDAHVPSAALAGEAGDLVDLLQECDRTEVACAALDGGPTLANAVNERLGPTPEGQQWLKALLSTQDGPQPGEPGFVQRFALPKVIAVRTLRHGADLALEPAE